ncbi:MAG: Gfo/Idh/MocA family oxidoreductase [Actinobacteria bacterium]|nr:Gfo/Idh/MocA family oxidoreductase [Actinomycetota bacterium]
MGVAWGLLSTARIAARVVAGATKTDAAEIVAVASRDGATAQAFADAHGIARAHGSYEALLADPAVEAVYIPLPNSMHVDWTLRALQAGKHVLCEKPMDRRPEQIARAFDVADEQGLVLSEGFMWRHNPQTQRLRELLDEATIGTVRLVRACFSFVLARDVDVRLDAALDGGALMDVGCYCVSGARLVAGEPLDVSAQVVTGPTGVDLRLSGLLRFDDHVLGVIDCGLDMYSRGELEIVGTEGRLLLPDPWHAISPRIVVERGFERETVKLDAADSYTRELEDAAAAIAGGGPPLLGRADALGQARTIEALYRAAAEARTVTLSCPRTS